MGPNLSIVQLSAMAPSLLTRPKVGRSPVAPHRVDGETIEPRVSLPIAKGTNPATVADVDPAEDPLLPCSRFQGFLVLPPYHTSPQAGAPNVNLATNTAPAASNWLIISAFSEKICDLKGVAPQVVLYPATFNKSLAP